MSTGRAYSGETSAGRRRDDACMSLDWTAWLSRWDAQQEGYVPDREARFTAMFDVLAALLPDSFTALDLGCGPGSLSIRLLERFPQARAVAVDMDPVMLALGEGAVGTLDGRLRWIDADLVDGDLPTVDAAVSSTALHWLTPDALTRLYRRLAGVIRPGGVLLNADALAYGSSTLDGLARDVLDDLWSDASFAARGIETAEQWWAAIGAEPDLAPQLAERARRFARKERPESTLGYDGHVAALREAGFREVGTVWQHLSDRVVLAVR
jgi:SAM-dependent methyltransferase